MSEVVRESVAAYGAQLRPMTVREYYLAAEKGVFSDDEKLELLRGEVVWLSPQKSPHAWATGNVREELRAVFPSACMREHSPLRLDDFNEPEPDLLVAPGPLSLYRKKHPGPADTLLVVEVADSSLRKDRTLKTPLYAEFGIPEYWILNLKDGSLEVYRDPTKPAGGPAHYAQTEVIGKDGFVTPLKGNGGSIAVGELFPD